MNLRKRYPRLSRAVGLTSMLRNDEVEQLLNNYKGNAIVINTYVDLLGGDRQIIMDAIRNRHNLPNPEGFAYQQLVGMREKLVTD
jgi:hypothetical protein